MMKIVLQLRLSCSSNCLLVENVTWMQLLKFRGKYGQTFEREYKQVCRRGKDSNSREERMGLLQRIYLRGLHIVSFHQITFMGSSLARTWYLLKKYVPVFL
jgi:hypothetical protein